jgi:hypothetical protein
MSEDASIYGTGCHYCDELEANCGMHGVSPWIPADKELPGNPRCVLATDGECHFIAVYEGVLSGNPNSQVPFLREDTHWWVDAHTSEEIDSVITHWMELPEVPE